MPLDLPKKKKERRGVSFTLNLSYLNSTSTSNSSKVSMQFTLLMLLEGLESRKVIHPNNGHSIPRTFFRTLYKLQRLFHYSFDQYYIAPKLIIPKEDTFFYKRNRFNIKLFRFYSFGFSDYQCILSYSIRPLLRHFKYKQQPYKRKIHSLLTQNVRINIPKF